MRRLTIVRHVTSIVHGIQKKKKKKKKKKKLKKKKKIRKKKKKKTFFTKGKLGRERMQG